MEALEFDDDLEDPNSAKFIELARIIIEKVCMRETEQETVFPGRILKPMLVNKILPCHLFIECSLKVSC